MPAFTADSTTLAAILGESTYAAKREAVDDALGEGTLTFAVTNGTTLISGTFSGSLWGDAVLAVDDVEIADKTGDGGEPTDAYSIRVTGAGGAYVEFPPGSWSFVGADGAAEVETGDEIRITIRYAQDDPPAPSGNTPLDHDPFIEGFKILDATNYIDAPTHAERFERLGMMQLPVVYESTFYPEEPDRYARGVPTEAGITAALNQVDVAATTGAWWVDIELISYPIWPWVTDSSFDPTFEMYEDIADAIAAETERPFGFYGWPPLSSVLSAGKQQEGIPTHTFAEMQRHNDMLTTLASKVDFFAPRCYVTYSAFQAYHYDAWKNIAAECKRLDSSKPAFAVISPDVQDPGGGATFRQLTQAEFYSILTYMKEETAFDGVIIWGGYNLTGGGRFTWNESDPFLLGLKQFYEDQTDAPPPADDLTIPVEDLIAAQQEASTIQPDFGTHINDEPVIRSANYAAIQAYLASAPPGQDDFDDYFDEIYPWLWAYGADGHDYGQGYRLEARRCLVSVKKVSDGTWTDFYPTSFTSNLAWNGNTQAGASTKLRTEVGTGNLSFSPTVTSDGVEVWPPVGSFKNRSLMVDSAAYAVICQVRIIDSAGQPYNGTDAKFAVSLGYDQYGGRSRGGADKYAAPALYPRIRADGGNSRWRLVTGGDWQAVTVYTGESYKYNENPHDGYDPPWPYDRSPYTLTAQQTRDNPPSWATVSDTSSTVNVFGGYVNPSPSYTPTTPPGGYTVTYMTPTDRPYKFNSWACGWHRPGTVTNPGFTLAHQRPHDYFAADNLDDGGVFHGRICRGGRHNYDKARFDAMANDNGGCPKILPVYMWAKWAVSAADQNEVRRRFGPENQYGQIHGVTRYPSFPYGGHAVENLEYIREYIRWVYRPTNQAGPGGEMGAGYTPARFPIIEYGNEQKFASATVNAGRWWDNPYSPGYNTDNAYYQGKQGPNAFNLQTMQEFAAGVRACKEAAPEGVLVAAGGWEGDYNGRTLSNPAAALSFFQAWALSSDGDGGIGIDHVDIVFFHPYMYSYNPNQMLTEIDGYRAQLEWLADYLDRPELRTMPIHANETGHEAPSGTDGEYGTGTYLINANGASAYNTLARDMKRSTLYAIANASRKQCVGITHYKDTPYATSGGKNNGRQTYGSPSENAVLSAAGQYTNQVNNRTVRQAYGYADGSVWVEFEDQLILQG